MELANVTSKGQATNSSIGALKKAQRAFAGEADKDGLKNDDVMAMIKQIRKESLVK